jgi:hypothetical protein
MEVIVEYLEVKDADGEVVIREQVADIEAARKRWDTLRGDWPDATALWHRHHHGDTASPCRTEDFP